MYQCSKCNKTFMHTAKRMEIGLTKEIKTSDGIQDIIIDGTVEFSVCPFCQSKEYDEFVEPPPEAEEVGNVYVYDLTTGPQTQLDQLLADGFKIVNRYSKQYHLEKPKANPAPKPDVLGEIIQAGIEQAKAEAQA